MPTNNFVESSFWNFDSLFQPQQHPARDAHDTFFMAGQGYTCFVDTFSYNLGQKVLLKNFALSYPQYTYPTDLVLLCCSVKVRNYPPRLQQFCLGREGRVFVVTSAFKSFILKLDMATSINSDLRWLDSVFQANTPQV